MSMRRRLEGERIKGRSEKIRNKKYIEVREGKEERENTEKKTKRE